MTMLANYLKNAFRHLWRNRLYTALNVLGLAIGLSACWIVYQLVSYELAFDQHQPNKEQVYRLVTKLQNSFMMLSIVGVPLPLPNVVRSQVPGGDRVVVLRQYWSEAVAVCASRPDGKPEQSGDIRNVVANDTNYFWLIPHQWRAGDITISLATPNQVVVAQSQNRAERYFPGQSLEEVVLLTVAAFQEIAYCASITHTIDQQTGRSISFPTVHATLQRLEEKGLSLLRWVGLLPSGKATKKACSPSQRLASGP